MGMEKTKNEFLNFFNNFKKEHSSCLSVLSLLVVVACGGSGSPTVSQIVPLAPPKIQGQTSYTATSPSSLYSVEGTCNKDAQLEYSLTGADNFEAAPNGGCQSDGTFQFDIILGRSKKVVLLRHKIEFTTSTNTVGKITFIKPPSAILMNFVAASSSPFLSLDEPTFAFTMPHDYTGVPSETADTYFMDYHATGIVYAEEQ